jgi:hypothetical protein
MYSRRISCAREQHVKDGAAKVTSKHLLTELEVRLSKHYEVKIDARQDVHIIFSWNKEQRRME